MQDALLRIQSWPSANRYAADNLGLDSFSCQKLTPTSIRNARRHPGKSGLPSFSKAARVRISDFYPILSAPGAISDETAARLKTHWDANYTGNNAGKVAVVGGRGSRSLEVLTLSDF